MNPRTAKRAVKMSQPGRLLVAHGHPPRIRLPPVFLAASGAFERGALVAPWVPVGRELVAEGDQALAASLTREGGIPQLRRILGHGPSSCGTVSLVCALAHRAARCGAQTVARDTLVWNAAAVVALVVSPDHNPVHFGFGVEHPELVGDFPFFKPKAPTGPSPPARSFGGLSVALG
jgi:hypothetical protein